MTRAAVLALLFSLLAPVAQSGPPASAAFDLARQLPVVDPNAPGFAANDCRLTPRNGLLPDDATCLAVLDVDLDGDRQRDRLLFFRIPRPTVAAPPDCTTGCAGGHIRPSANQSSRSRFARAVLGNGMQQDLAGWPAYRVPVQASSVFPYFGPHRVDDLDGDGGDDVLVLTDDDGGPVLQILTMRGGRLHVVAYRFDEGDGPIYAVVRQSAAGGRGYRCRDTTGDGRPDFQLVSWQAATGGSGWTWVERRYRWEGAGMYEIEIRRGSEAGDGSRDPRTADFVGEPAGSCSA